MEIFKKAAMVFWAIVWLSGICYSFYASAATKEYLQNPAVGDIYYVNYAYMDEMSDANRQGLSKYKAYSFMKLIDIDGESLHFLAHKFSATMMNTARNLTKNNREAYFPEPVVLSFARVHELYENDALLRIKRESPKPWEMPEPPKPAPDKGAK